jgi:hypothetical protein
MNDTELTLDERVEVALAVISGIGSPTEAELHPDPRTLSEAQKQNTVRDYLLSIARMELWVLALQALTPDERTDRTELLEAMLSERQNQACQIITVLQSAKYGVN